MEKHNFSMVTHLEMGNVHSFSIAISCFPDLPGVLRAAANQGQPCAGETTQGRGGWSVCGVVTAVAGSSPN